jgi:hypothetical protein
MGRKIGMWKVFFCFMFAYSNAFAEVPERLERESYRAWLEEIGSVQSVYLDSVFDWYEEQQQIALPPSVDQDPERLVISIDKPLQDTIEAEANGDIEKGVTYGLETYGVIPANIELVLETILFRWGKPVGAESGVTYPFDLVFGYRKESLFPFWGARTFRTETVMKNGGVAKDQSDINSLLLRGDSSGYVLAGSFFGANGRTPSTSSISIIYLKPMANDQTEYRVSGRYTGQSYALFGVEFGRRNYGFNAAKIRQGQKEFFSMVEELKTTGKIRERKPSKEGFEPVPFLMP